MVSAHHVEAWSVCDGAQLVGVADPNEDNTAQRSEQAGVAAFDSLAAMAKATHLDAVDIAAPVGLHGALIREAVGHGLHVLCQKPLVTSADEGRTLLADLPTGYGAPRVMVHENWRWRAPYQALKASELRGVESFEMRVESAGLLPNANGQLPALERQPFFRQLERFLVMEVLIHHLDTLAFLFGPLTIRSAELQRRCQQVVGEDYAHIVLRAGDVEGTLTGNFCVASAPPLPKDWLSVAANPSALADGWSLRVGNQPTQQWDQVAGYQGSYDATIQHFSDAVRHATPFATPAPMGVELLQRVEDIYRLGGSP